MQLKIKATGFSLTPSLHSLIEEKLLYPLERRLSREVPEDYVLEVEVAKVTKHHEEGRIWKCETRVPLPRFKKTIFVEVLEESLEAAVDKAKDELERQAGEYKEKQMAKFLRFSRRLKKDFHITRLARWFRKGRIRDERM